MIIGLISAMESEIVAIKQRLHFIKEEKHNNTIFYICRYKNNTIILNTCFEGKVNAAMNIQMLIDKYNIDLVINIGVAGSISNKVKIGDIVIATSTVEHDYNIMCLGYERGNVLGIDKIFIPCFSDIDLNTVQDEKEHEFSIEKGVIASGDIFISEKEMKEKINKKYDAIAVDMESASIAHVCFAQNIKCMCIRAISDSNDKIEFREFLKLAVENLTTVALKVLNKF